MSDRELAERYRSVLDLLAQGQLDAAGDALTAFETAAVVGNIEKQLDRLFRSEADIIRWIGGQELESIVPLLVLHLESSQRYRRQNHPILGQHARRMAINLANLYVKEAGTAGSRQIGGWAMTSLGGEALKGGLHRSSLELFYQALELDPDNSLALLSVASVEEKHGRYEEAVEKLELLVSTDPNNSQGRLRLAVNLGRLGKDRRAIDMLTALSHEEQAFEWVRAISYQELARLHARNGDWSKAEAVIHRGLEQYPGDARLQVYLSYVLEHTARYRAALQVIRKVDDGGGRQGASPRYRYGLWPRGPAGEDPYDVMRVGLKQTAERRVARLAAVLSRVGVGAGAAAP